MAMQAEDVGEGYGYYDEERKFYAVSKGGKGVTIQTPE